ncbi:hypothetical protein ScPMuIL_002922 [Solemya velum]
MKTGRESKSFSWVWWESQVSTWMLRSNAIDTECFHGDIVISAFATVSATKVELEDNRSDYVTARDNTQRIARAESDYPV